MATGGFHCMFTYKPLICRKCNEYLCDPQMATCCKQNFCNSCIAEVIEKQESKCPVCKKDFEYSPNNELNKVLLNFSVFCMYNCGWRGTLREHDRHVNSQPTDQTWLDGCGKLKLRCIYCKDYEEMRKDYIQCFKDHLLKKSSIRDKIPCPVEAMDKWKEIGHELGLSDETLQSIAILADSKDAEPYPEMLTQWIQHPGKHKPAWRRLIKAFRHPTVNLEHLSKTIEQAFVCGKNCEIQIQTLVKQAKRLKEEYENKIGLGDIKNRMQECQDSFSDKVDEVEFEQTIRVELESSHVASHAFNRQLVGKNRMEQYYQKLKRICNDEIGALVGMINKFDRRRRRRN